MVDLSNLAPAAAPEATRELAVRPPRRPLRLRRGRRRLAVIRAAVAVFFLTAALIGGVVYTLTRNVQRTNAQQAATELASGARVAASAFTAIRANLRAEAGQLATSLDLQRAIVADNNTKLRRIALTHHAAIFARGTVTGSLPPQPRITSTATISEGGRVIARVTVGVPLDAKVLALVREATPLPSSTALMLARRGRVVAGGPIGGRIVIRDGRLTFGKVGFLARAAPLGIANTTVLALKPVAALDAQAAPYRRRLMLAALLTLALAGVLATRLARPLARMFGELSHEALTDSLTGIANRRAIDDRLDEELERASRHGTHLALVLVDIDDFKQVNDAYGHQTGDEVLRAISVALAASVRELDLAGRFGGEEFALVLPGTQLDGACMVAEMVREAINACSVRSPDGKALRVTASFGAAVYPAHGTVDALVRAADGALYDAKRSGKDRVAAAAAST